jgi:hypothetical protein
VYLTSIFSVQGGEAGLMLRIVAQKVNADGRTYLLREIYGIEQKRDGAEPRDGDEEDEEDDDTECVVSEREGRSTTAQRKPRRDSCTLASFLFPPTHTPKVCMSEPMDTMVLPCRHLCLCNSCAEVLRYQASKCPICRAPFHSLLKISVAKREEDLSPEQLEREPVRRSVDTFLDMPPC